MPGHNLTLRATPRINAQEMNLTTRYWEGAVALTGMAGATPVTGAGYIELTGYGEQ